MRKPVEWLGPKKPGDGFLFVKDGRPPQPDWVPKRGRFGGELRTVYSQKMQRDFNLCWPLEWNHFLILDCDPLVKWICEHPLQIDAKLEGKKTMASFDMWILWQDGHEELREVKPSENEEQSLRQISLQRQWSELIGIKHQVVTEKEVAKEPLLANCRRMHPFLTQNPGARWEKKVLDLVDQSSPVPLRKVVGATPLDTQKMLHAAIHLIWRGELIAQITTEVWEKLTLRRPTDEDHRDPYC